MSHAHITQTCTHSAVMYASICGVFEKYSGKLVYDICSSYTCATNSDSSEVKIDTWIFLRHTLNCCFHDFTVAIGNLSSDVRNPNL